MVNKKNDFYSSARTKATEIDIRTEFLRTMYGAGPEIAKSQSGLLRVFRRASSLALIQCPCLAIECHCLKRENTEGVVL